MDQRTNKPAPNEKTILAAIKILISYGHWKWKEEDGFKPGKHDALVLKVWLDNAVKAGRLLRGTWQARTWIGFTTLSRIVRAYVDRAITKGTLSWDLIIARCLSITLVASLGVRAGDLARSRFYAGQEYLQYRHLHLYLDGNEPRFENLRLEITLEYIKGHKDIDKDEKLAYLEPLNDVSNSHVCPVSWLLVHVLRHDLVAGRDLQDVLDRAAARDDLTVEFLYPDRPVLTLFGTAPLHCMLDMPARPDQLLHSIRRMGLVGGMLGRAYTHALRLGGARDVAHLPSSVFDGVGLTNDAVRQRLSHTSRTSEKGITEDYTGGASIAVWSEVAKNASTKTHRREPAFASTKGPQPLDLVSAPVSEQEIADAMTRSKQGCGRKGALFQVHQLRTRELASNLDREPRRSAPLPSKPSPMPALPTRTIQHADMDAITASARHRKEPESETKAVDPSLAEVAAQLDDEQLGDLAAQLSQADVDELETTLIGTGARTTLDTDTLLFVPQEEELNLDQINENTGLSVAEDAQVQEAAKVLLDDQGVVPSLGTTPADWVTAYARVNVVDNSSFAGLWLKHCRDPACVPVGPEFERIFAKFCNQGGSRDEPSPKLYYCRTSGCPFVTVHRDPLRSHEESCNEDRAVKLSEGLTATEAGQVVKCAYQGCIWTASPGALRPEHALQTHIRTMHDFVPKPCPDSGCDPNRVYQDQASYDYHMSHKHSGRWPVWCKVPGCQHPRPFANMHSYKYHLEHPHKLDSESLVQYLPERDPTPKWVSQSCFLPGCTETFDKRAAQTKHLQTEHGMDAKTAKTEIDQNGEFEMVVPKQSTRKKRGPSGRSVKAILDTSALEAAVDPDSARPKKKAKTSS